MRNLLTETGRALYGERWQSPLARDLGVSDRTVRRWISGANAMPETVYIDLLKLIDNRDDDLRAVAERLRVRLQ